MTKTELLNKYTSVTPLAKTLSDRPVVLYGTGNGADKVIKMILGPLGIKPAAVFASDGFVRNREFAGLPVESFSEVAARYGKDMKILMCFGSDREEVLSFVEELDAEYDLAIPDVPLYGEGLFDAEYLRAHADELFEVRSMLADGYSKDLFDDAVLYRLTGKYKYLKRTQDVADPYRELFGRTSVRSAADCGAYRGETSKMFLDVFPGIEKVYALEPDPGSYKKMCESVDDPRIVPLNFAASDGAAEITFSGSASRGAGAQGKNRRAKEKTVKTARLDELIKDPVDLVKLDVEGDEEKALLGAYWIMAEDGPSLSVSLYHRTDDIWKLPLYIKNFSNEYDRVLKYYLRRPRCVPCWDLTLFAVKEDPWN